MRPLIVLLVASLMLALAAGLPAAEKKPFEIAYEKFQLRNGLQVILHEDRSDPLVAVAILYHVGSNREQPGRTGFAHLFEHMLFQASQHVGQDQFFRKVQEAGGTLNGGTWEDGTIYFQVVPRNALEMVLWLESDRMGFLLPTVTQEAFENQQSVVQNEKRQRVDNVPYGHTGYVIHKLLFPADHPYNWQVIGSFEDLRNATLADVRSFFTQWYGPGNATLVVAGDYDPVQTRAWIEKYFAELPASPPVAAPALRPVQLDKTRRAFHEDNFAVSPELNMVFPTVPQYHPDSYALTTLAQLLAGSKKAPLYKVLVEEQKLAPGVSAWQNSMEIAGHFRIRVRAFPASPLSQVEQAIQAALARFEQEGFTEKDLARLKAGTETSFYSGIASALSKANRLAEYNTFAGSPDFLSRDLENSLKVTSEEVWRVYRTYVKQRPCVLTSFVPKGKLELVAADSERFPVVEEAIMEEAAAERPPSNADQAVEKMPTSFDRSVEPAKGPAPAVTVPPIWTHTYRNGLRLYGITHRELPLVETALYLKGGLLLDPPDKIGTAYLVGKLMKEGTRNRTPQELEEAIDELGATVDLHTTEETLVLQTRSLASRLPQLQALVEEMLLQPRWDAQEFARLQQETLELINRRSVDPNEIATTVYRRLLYGPDHLLGRPVIGTAETVGRITLTELQQYYERNFSPRVAHVTVVGSISREEAIKLFRPLEQKWPARELRLPELPVPPAPEQPKLYFVDVPGAKQSQIRVGYLGPAQAHPDFHAVTVMNYKLGGSFNGILNLILREEKGYTYGARSAFQGGAYPGPFVAYAGVRSNTTRESLQIFREEIGKYRNGLSEADLQFTRNALLQANALRFETLGALRNMLNQIASYGLPLDFVKQQEAFVRQLTGEQHRALARQYLDPDKMFYLVVGDAETQLAGLQELGWGQPMLLNREAEPVR